MRDSRVVEFLERIELPIVRRASRIGETEGPARGIGCTGPCYGLVRLSLPHLDKSASAKRPERPELADAVEKALDERREH